MFISTLELFKVGIGPSSSHTMGPLLAANQFAEKAKLLLSSDQANGNAVIKCFLKGSLAHTGKGHATDRAVLLGLHGHIAEQLATQDVDALVKKTSKLTSISQGLVFHYPDDIFFDTHETLAEHPNGMVFCLEQAGEVIFSETYFSIGGGFIATTEELRALVAPMKMHDEKKGHYPFDSGESMLAMAKQSALSIAEMKWQNELDYLVDKDVIQTGLNQIWQAMRRCVEAGLNAEGILPGSLKVQRRAKSLFELCQEKSGITRLSDTLCAYAMAVNEENAAGHGVVTAPTNGAAGVIPAVLYYFLKDESNLDLTKDKNKVQDFTNTFLLTAAAIGGIIKHRSSISGAEVGCQGEVGSAAAMAAAGLCAVLGGSPEQVENAAEIALEHHLGMTCDPVAGLVQVPCIERNGFGAIKAYTAASLALQGTGEHLISLDQCIAAMKQTGKEMSEKYKETSLGGLAVAITEC